MKIVLHTKRFQPQPFGEQLYVENFLKALIKLLPPGWHADVHVTGWRGLKQHYEQLDRLDPAHALGRRTTLLPYTALRLLMQTIGFPGSVIVPGPADLVHNLTPQWLPPCRNFVLTIQDLLILRPDVDQADESLREEIRQSLRYLDSFAKRIITISEFSKSEIVRLMGFDADKITVIRDGVDQEVFHPANRVDEEFAKQVLPGLQIHGPYLIHMGGSAPRKNVERLIQAFDIFKSRTGAPHQLVLVGAGRNEALRQAVARSYHAQSIVCPGYLSTEELVALLQQSEALVFPSTYEGFGLPPLEAMACGVPVAVAHATALPEVAGDAALYFDPLDTESMAVAIERVVCDQELRKQCIQRGFKRAGELSWEANARQTLQIYREVAGV